ncbi:hypothetical protein NC652_010086 [Populus alba x Populus x berolinensis]|uniref:Uncharacterized protein n=1 Tax=Populus alba x Populus x berolinensis TaxID=444605 RepID=A0AAD6QZ17_9ROSI|nr:hypothetical protein NC651_009882 [Populus alba x Populus x berolinensis]KAJ6934988.1 hypothetical protein NC652_010086 [Populus alba x Populus x berolinensis]KAJ6999321.1 hypothetical protein NC653_010114 [Populus alba x Populus x berolinensis]
MTVFLSLQQRSHGMESWVIQVESLLWLKYQI